MADIFVSYTSSDREWSFWIANELRTLGHTPHVHEWEIKTGEDIYAWLEQRHDAADHVLCVVSDAYRRQIGAIQLVARACRCVIVMEKDLAPVQSRPPESMTRNFPSMKEIQRNLASFSEALRPGKQIGHRGDVPARASGSASPGQVSAGGCLSRPVSPSRSP
jgi:hypothetical protein